MHVLDANEIFWMTFYTYDRIIEEGGNYWPDALALYIKLIKQTRIQQTNQTYSLDSFLENWLGWGYKRLKNAKNVLKSLGLIDNLDIDTLLNMFDIGLVVNSKLLPKRVNGGVILRETTFEIK